MPLNFSRLKKSIKYLLLVLLIAEVKIFTAQINLVPNPSFEDIVTCPKGYTQLNVSKFWSNPTKATPDYFNSCATTISSVGVPTNGDGFQAARTGNAYAGLIAFHNLWPQDSWREYIQIRLDSNLIQGEQYCLTFYLSLAEQFNYAVNNIGAYFSVLPIGSVNIWHLQYTPQIINTSANPLIDTTVWMKVSGSFIASGGERYITIGNFNGNKNSDTVFVHKTAITYKASYYYIDDVSVIHLNAGAGEVKGICNNIGTTIGRPGQSGITYNWSPSIGLSDTAIAQPIATPSVTTTYYLTATLTSSGCTKTDSVTVYYIPSGPTAAISVNKSTLCAEETGIALAVLNSTANPVSYSWSNGSSGMQVSNLEVGNYTVTITDALGCTATATTSITPKPPCECGEDVFVPNVFSPNNDGKNDVLYIEGNGLINIYWGIYDRWGNLVFETKDSAKGWNGTFNGNKSEQGIYMYYLTGTCVKTNSMVSLKGDVSMLR